MCSAYQAKSPKEIFLINCGCAKIKAERKIGDESRDGIYFNFEAASLFFSYYSIKFFLLVQWRYFISYCILSQLSRKKIKKWIKRQNGLVITNTFHGSSWFVFSLAGMFIWKKTSASSFVLLVYLLNWAWTELFADMRLKTRYKISDGLETFNCCGSFYLPRLIRCSVKICARAINFVIFYRTINSFRIHLFIYPG